VAAAPYPQLGPGEQVLAETPLGGATAVLTDRRLVVAGRGHERSLPLAHIAVVGVRFERAFGAIALGVALIIAALILFSITSPLRTLILNQSVGLEPAASQERAANPDTSVGIAVVVQKVLEGAARVVGVFPVAGWLLLLIGLARIVIGAIGRTVVTVAAGGAEVEFAKRGNSRPLQDFVTEVGRQLPGPARPAPR
jgi:hypothetical protein